MPDLKPIACAMPDGRIAVYIGSDYKYLPREKTMELIAQLCIAVGDGNPNDSQLDHAVHAYKVASVARMAMETEPQGHPTAAVLNASIREGVRAALAQNTPSQHTDDGAVDRFAAALKAKLAEARAKGRGGWQDKADCPQQRLSDMLRAHVEKGDPRDVANFCMFLHQRGESILPAQTSCDLQPPNDYNRGYSAGWDAAKANAERARVPDNCMVVPLLKPDEMQALRRFAETTEDDESYDVPKDMMAFLSLHGAVTRSASRKDWFWLTDYGRMLLAAAPSQPEDAVEVPHA